MRSDYNVVWLARFPHCWRNFSVYAHEYAWLWYPVNQCLWCWWHGGWYIYDTYDICDIDDVSDIDNVSDIDDVRDDIDDVSDIDDVRDDDDSDIDDVSDIDDIYDHDICDIAVSDIDDDISSASKKRVYLSDICKYSYTRLLGSWRS